MNLSGSFPLGTLVGLGAEDRALLLMGTGLLGSYTTFSTWMVESHRLAQAEHWTLAGLNLLASLVAGLAAVSIGVAAGAAMAS